MGHWAWGHELGYMARDASEIFTFEFPNHQLQNLHRRVLSSSYNYYNYNYYYYYENLYSALSHSL